MKLKTFNLIGAGRIGINLGRALIMQNLAELKSVYNLHFEKAITACQLMEAGNPIPSMELLTEADITWITCTDDAISEVVEQLLLSTSLKKGSLVIHCSGVLNSEALAPLKVRGCSVASIHPLKAIAHGNYSNNVFEGVHCVIEGDAIACEWLTQAFQRLKAQISTIQPEDKARYHAGACMASNFLITLAYHAEQLLLDSGISKGLSKNMITELMQSNINNVLKTDSIQKALTGPIARGDINTLKLHLEAIQDPLINQLYREAALATLPVSALSPNQKIQMKLLLENS